MSSFSTSHYQIFDYWKDKCIDQFGNVKDDITENYSGTIEVVRDWGEPNCWCCDSVIPVENESNFDEWIETSDYKGIWNSRTVKKRTERAHIVPRMLGGTDDPSNLFLLCPICHKLSPDTDNPKMFLSYIYDRRKNKSKAVQFYLDAQDILKERYGIKFPVFDKNVFEGVGMHCGTVQESTKTYQLVNNALKNRTALSEKEEKMFKKYLEEKIKELEREISANIGNVEEKKSRLSVYQEVLGGYEAFKKVEEV